MKSLIVVLLLAQDGKGPSIAKVLAKTQKEKKYSFHITGGASAVTGEFDQGCAHYASGSEEVAGRGGVSSALHDGKWVDIQSLLAAKIGGDTLARLSQLQPPHVLVSRVVGLMTRLSGDGNSGFTGQIFQPQAGELAKEPWISHSDLRGASTLKSDVAISCDSEQRVSKIEIQFAGSKYELKKTGSYYGKPDPKNPPRPPASNWQLGPDGYWYEGQEKSVSVKIVLEFSGWGAASLPEELKKKFGLK
jgi:hypothetical protein